MIINKIIYILLIFTLLFFLSNKVSASPNVSWTDLPKDDLREIFYEYDPKLDKLNDILNQYHQIAKKDWHLIQKRIDMLEYISSYCYKISFSLDKKYLKEATLKLSTIAKMKASYLKELKDLKSYKLKELKKLVFDKNLIPKPYLPLILNNKKKYNFKTEEVWGEYFIEAVDPCHRRLLNSYYDVWLNKCRSCELHDFFLWLEEQNVSVFFPSIRLFDTHELEKSKIYIKNGLLYDNNGKLINSKIDLVLGKPERIGPTFETEHIFIINDKEEIYLTYSNKEVGHTSLSHYKPLIASGKLYIRNGKIEEIAFDSGHYLPNEVHDVQTIKFFEEKGIKFNPKTILKFFKKHDYIVTTVGEFKVKYMLPDRGFYDKK